MRAFGPDITPTYHTVEVPYTYQERVADHSARLINEHIDPTEDERQLGVVAEAFGTMGAILEVPGAGILDGVGVSMQSGHNQETSVDEFHGMYTREAHGTTSYTYADQLPIEESWAGQYGEATG